MRYDNVKTMKYMGLSKIDELVYEYWHSMDDFSDLVLKIKELNLLREKNGD